MTAIQGLSGISVFERGWLSANNILFIGQSGTALIDSGYHTHADQTVALVRHGLAGRGLDLLLNTHLHSDHCGGNAALQLAFPSVETLVPPGQAELVRHWDPIGLTYVPTGQHCPRFQMDGLLEPGSIVVLADQPWQVHASPGHDPNSVVLFEPNSRTLISADALWENGFGVVFQELEGARAFEEVADTLNLIEVLNPTLVIPGHGRVFTDVAKSLAAARRRLEGFVQNPVKHATHAAKVLLKFKLLEMQRLSMADFSRWAQETAYFRMVHARWFADIALDGWIVQLADDLARSGAARRQNDEILNA